MATTKRHEGAQAFLANLAHAIRTNETVNIGGGIFTPDELRGALTYVQDLHEVLSHCPQWIGKGISEGAFEKCVAPDAAAATMEHAQHLVGSVILPRRLPNA